MSVGLLLLLRILLVALVGIGVDGLAVAGGLAHRVLSLLLLLLNGLSSDWLLRDLLVMYLDHDVLTLGGIVAADGSVVFGNAASAFSSSDAGDYAEDKEETSEGPPEPDESGMTVARVVAHVIITAIRVALAVRLAVRAIAHVVVGAIVVDVDVTVITAAN